MTAHDIGQSAQCVAAAKTKKEDTIVREEYRDEYVSACPYCGGTEMIEAFQGAMAP